MADPKFTYPLRDSINNVLGYPDNPALDEDVSIFQQSFLGMSIVDFTCNLGFNTSASSLSLNLVQDEAFRFTPLVRDGVRNAITEGYHPWEKWKRVFRQLVGRRRYRKLSRGRQSSIF